MTDHSSGIGFPPCASSASVLFKLYFYNYTCFDLLFFWAMIKSNASTNASIGVAALVFKLHLR